jgi:methylthioribose-1-phosphate isomerase
MKAVQTATAPNFESVWATLDRISKSQEETDQIMKENAQMFKELGKKQEETNRQIGKLGNRFGEMVEYMVVPNLVQKFRERGFEFEKAYQNATIEDKENNIFTEVDITLENGDKVMLVEVKSKPTTENVTEHIERMEKVRNHGDQHGDNRTFLGAVAGIVFNDNVKQFALKCGFYVIEPSGETFIITAPEGKYTPREW